MSARAGSRLSSLGFTNVYRYQAGKADWFAAGLPREGKEAHIPRVADVAMRDVATYRLDERVSDVRDRMRADKLVRHVTPAQKRHAYALYGATPKPGVCCEVDHLIPLELGGSNDNSNLWPEPVFAVAGGPREGRARDIPPYRGVRERHEPERGPAEDRGGLVQRLPGDAGKASFTVVGE